jgi:hypothetical protein
MVGKRAIHITELTTEHLKQYSQIDAVSGESELAEYEPYVWRKPPMAGFVSPPNEEPVTRTETLLVRIDRMDDEHLQELSETIAAFEKGNRKAKG